MSSDTISLTEFSKTYKKLKKNKNISTALIDDALDKLNENMLNMMKNENNMPLEKLDKNEYIERRLNETMCICSILFAMEYDNRFENI